MRLEFGRNLFDEYNWKARVLPALITLAPIVFASAVSGWADKLAIIVSLAASLGLIFLLAQMTRTLGKKVEEKLIKGWQGFPTTHALRFATQQNVTIFNSRRTKIESLFSIKLPSRQAERRNPQRADDEYIAATKSLISKVRSQQSLFPRVHEENINYGFRRNLLGLKPIGVCLSLIALIGSIATTLTVGWLPETMLIFVIGFLFGLMWLTVHPTWVWGAANSYSERLFETLDGGLK